MLNLNGNRRFLIRYNLFLRKKVNNFYLGIISLPVIKLYLIDQKLIMIEKAILSSMAKACLTVRPTSHTDA